MTENVYDDLVVALAATVIETKAGVRPVLSVESADEEVTWKASVAWKGIIYHQEGSSAKEAMLGLLGAVERELERAADADADS